MEQPSQIKNCGSDVCVYDQCRHDLMDASALMALSEPPKKRAKIIARGPAPLVDRCRDFTDALKAEGPPGVLELFQDIKGKDQRAVILKLVELLKPTPHLLKKFLLLLPKWCFTSSKK